MEAGILTGLAHEHIVEMRNFYKWDYAYCLAMEHMEGGELCEDIIRRVFYSEACARRVILQVLQALAYLHRRGILHRDVKPENLLLRRRGDEAIKLADFGLATVLSRPTYKVVEPVGSPGYAAPELLRVFPYDGKADVFSLGVISFVLLSGYLPFGGASAAETVKNTLDGNPSFDDVQWGAVSEGAKDFVKLLLTPDQNKRPTAESAMSHPWMKVHGKTLLTRSLSDRRSGVAKPLLEEFQKLQKQRLKAAVGAVVAANRFHRLLATGCQESSRDGVVSHGDEQPAEKQVKDKIARDEEKLVRPQEETRLAPHVEGVVSLLEDNGFPPQEEERRTLTEDKETMCLTSAVVA
ncbi:unnamed protein product [Scytosiphon promiscuus]